MPITKSEEETMALAKIVGDKVKNGGIVELIGDVGSGKTVFAKGIAKYLEIYDFKIKSPTYTFIRQFRNLYHIDLYRMDYIDELLISEIDEIASDKRNIVIIEWPERLPENIFDKCEQICFEHMGKNKRRIDIYEYNRTI